ncbi:hypothetical protein [Microbacterium sp. GXS0129]|uniref:hypothetical protein n=1 Tax=Microbacterium sp. GXS0129 TaxID=3377836 RepID=UPI00383AF5C2
MHRRALLPLVLAAFLGLTACAPASEVDAHLLSEQAEDYVVRSGPGSLGSGTFFLSSQNTDGGSVTLGEMRAGVTAVRAICFGEGKASVSFELRGADSTIANTFDVTCDSAEHDSVFGESLRGVTKAELSSTWVSGFDQAVVVSVVSDAN